MDTDLPLLHDVVPVNGITDSDGTSYMNALEEALIAIRRILRATEIHSKALRSATGLKTSHLLVLQALEDVNELTIGQITDQIRMAQASVTSIVARLEKEGLVARIKGDTDKRKVFVHLTDAGRELLHKAPEALHQRFEQQFEPLEEWEKSMIIAALQRVASMMDAGELDAAPLLDYGHHAHHDRSEPL